MTDLVIISQDEAMRAILTIIGQDHQLTVTTYQQPLAALQWLAAREAPTIALFDVWLDRWDDGSAQLLARYGPLFTRHAAIVLWDAHSALPPVVRDAFAARRITVVKKPLELALLDAALNMAIQRMQPDPDTLPFIDDIPSGPRP